MSHEKIVYITDFKDPEIPYEEVYTPDTEGITATLGNMAIGFAFNNLGGNLVTAQAPEIVAQPSISLDSAAVEGLLAVTEYADKRSHKK